ncbi:hypothetical protein OHR68_42445 [Spirillospora sp. NBC_00431]
MRNVIAISALTAGLAGLTIAAVQPAANASGSSSETGNNCVVSVDGAGSVTCYNSFTKAIADATGGHIMDAPADPAAATADPRFNSRINALGERADAKTARAAVVLEIAYEDKDFNRGQPDNDIYVFKARRGCDRDNGVEHRNPDLPNSWNDRISSFNAYNACQANHYQNNNYRGRSTGWFGSHGRLSRANNMNDRASSIQWR